MLNFEIWRYVKLIEQIGFCHFKLGREQIGLDYFGKVLRWYGNSEIDDLAVPVEMLDFLPPDHEYIIRIKRLFKFHPSVFLPAYVGRQVKNWLRRAKGSKNEF